MNVSILTPVVALATIFSVVALSGASVSWDSVPREELALTEPSIREGAERGVEVLFRETTVDESDVETSVTRTHVRFKIFDARGVERMKRLDVRYNARESRVTAIGARVIKPDGTVVEVERKSFFTREVIRNQFYQYKAVSCSLPALEPGVIVEYKVTFQGEPQYWGFFALQDEFPTRVVRYRIKPPVLARLQLLTLYHRCPPLKPQPDGDYFAITLESVAGARDEPFAPPDEQVRSWMMYYYTFGPRPPEKYWGDLGRDLFKEFDKITRSRPDLDKACAAIIAGAATDREKLERIDTFCRTQVRNMYSDASGYTPDELVKLKPNKSPSDTLERKYGNANDLRLLFIALARAAGFDARLARSSDRSGTDFDRNMVVGYTIPDWVVAVNLDGTWWFTQPNIPYLPFGSLHWSDEGQVALVADPKAPPFVATQISPAEQSQRKRQAILTLSADGTLEGDVTIELTGHVGVAKKEELDDETPSRREELVRTEVIDRLPAAEVTVIELPNLTAPIGPAIIRYHLKVPGYASATGQRLFLQPSVFEVESPSVFVATERKHPIFFPYRSMEVDRVEIRLPAGFALENAHAPEGLKPGPTLTYDPQIVYRKSDHTLVYTRTFALELRAVAAGQYKLVQEIFDHIHQQDAHTVGLHRDDAGPDAAEKPAAASPPAI